MFVCVCVCVCRRFHVYMEYHKLHNVKMFVLSEVVEEIVTADPPLRDDQKDQLWVKKFKRVRQSANLLYYYHW